MKSARFFIMILFISLVGQGAIARQGDGGKQIRFEKGAICARVRGQLAAGQDAVNYGLQAREGQRLIVNLAPAGEGIEFANSATVTAPSGAQEGGKGGVIYDGKLAESGEYKIRVGRNLMATQGGKAGFVLEVVIY
jgi:hypothetical protein